jgi:hypothetical protein
MDVRAGYLTCGASGAEVSASVRAQLEEIVGGSAAAVEPRPDQAFAWGVRWYCPADGQPLTEVEGVLRCGACARAIPGHLVYEIVEFNPH